MKLQTGLGEARDILCGEYILLLKINPVYTFKACSKCGMKDKSLSFGYSDDADNKASLNILQRGLLTTSTTKQESPFPLGMGWVNG